MRRMPSCQPRCRGPLAKGIRRPIGPFRPWLPERFTPDPACDDWRVGGPLPALRLAVATAAGGGRCRRFEPLGRPPLTRRDRPGTSMPLGRRDIATSILLCARVPGCRLTSPGDGIGRLPTSSKGLSRSPAERDRRSLLGARRGSHGSENHAHRLPEAFDVLSFDVLIPANHARGSRQLHRLLVRRI